MSITAMKMALDPDTLEIMAGNFYVTDAIRRDAAFIAAANPETIKQLVELVRLQHAALMMLDYGTRFDKATEAIEAFNKWEGK